MKKWLLVFLSLSFLPSCITTRATIAEEQEKTETKTDIANLREGTVTLQDQMKDLQEQFRELNGKIEMTEGRYRSISEDEQMQSAQLEEKWKAFAGRFELLLDSVTKLEEKVTQMSSEMEAMKKDIAAAQKTPPAKRPEKISNKGNFTQAEESFEKGQWKEAALNYQKYREMNPKGRRYERATYRMGVCFKKLNLDSEAKVFFNELLDRFPQSHYARQAREELKSLK